MVAVCVTWGLALATGIGFAIAWVALPLAGAVVMALSGGSLAMVLRW